MGVKYLWDIIDEAKSKETLDCLRGKILSVDLSIWIVEAAKTLQFKTSILKPHLRNIFYRILCLRRLGIKLIFVTEGEAPDLKQDTMKQRNQQRYGTKSNTKSKVGRTRFQRTINECCRLLDLLGVPHVKAAGEAEAMCAVLNKLNLDDGCLTNDGDFFLYGGKVVYRDFGIDPKDPHVLRYDLDTIKQRVGIIQEDMIGLALICGCDYTKGVAGVGKGTVTKFLEEKSFSEDLIQRFKKWHEKDFFSKEHVEKSEINIVRKALKSENFLNQKILDEYLIDKDKVDKDLRKKLRWGYPDIKGLQEFLLTNLEWPFEYTLSKVLQLSSSTYLEKLSDSTFYNVPISPIQVVKTRCQHGVPLVEIEWKITTDNNTTYSKKWDNCPETFATLENQQVVLKVLPGLVEEFAKKKEEKIKGTQKKKKKKKSDTENISKETNDAEFISKDETENNKNYDICKEFEKITTNDDENEFSSSENESDDEECTVLPLSQRLATRFNKTNSALSEDTSIQENDCKKSFTAPSSTRIVELPSNIKLPRSIKSSSGIELPHNVKLSCKTESSHKIESTVIVKSSSTVKLPHSEKSSSTVELPHSVQNPSTVKLQHSLKSYSIVETSYPADKKRNETENEVKTFEISRLSIDDSLLNDISLCDLVATNNITQNTIQHGTECNDISKTVETPKFVHNELHMDDVYSAETTPSCFDTDTPILNVQSTPCNKSHENISQSVKKKISSAFKDITNFSQLGDSILCDSLELFDEFPEHTKQINVTPMKNEEHVVTPVRGGENLVTPVKGESYEDILRRQFAVSSVKRYEYVAADSPVLSSTENSPLCLADRLKARAKKRR